MLHSEGHCNFRIGLLYGVYDVGFILFLMGLFCHLCLSYYVFFSQLV